MYTQSLLYNNLYNNSMLPKIKMNLQCPMPKFDFDVITMGHGSGGLLTHKFLQSGVFDILKNELLDQQHDGAIFELNGKTAFSTDSYVISPKAENELAPFAIRANET